MEILDFRTQLQQIVSEAGFSSFGMPCYAWARQIVQRLRLHTDRHIRIRSHRHVKITPALIRDRENLDWIMQNVKNVSISGLNDTDIMDDLKKYFTILSSIE